MSVASIIRDRHSYRAYDPSRKISEEDMALILEAALNAPSAHNRQPFRIYRLKSAEAREKIYRCWDRAFLRDAPEILMVVGEEEEAWVYKDGRNSAVYIDCAIATSYMEMQAWDLGIGSLWVCAFDREKVCELFGFEMGRHTPVNLLVLGYEPDGVSKKPRLRKSLSALYSEL